MSSILDAAMDALDGEEEISRTIVVNGRRTVIRISAYLWDVLDRIAHDRDSTTGRIVREVATTTTVDAEPAARERIEAALRVYILLHVRDGAGDPDTWPCDGVVGAGAVSSGLRGRIHPLPGLHEDGVRFA